MKIVGFDHEAPRPQKPVTKVARFYVHSATSWAVVSRDEDGNQIGDATYVYSEREARNEQESRLKAAGLPVRGNMVKERACG